MWPGRKAIYHQFSIHFSEEPSMMTFTIGRVARCLHAGRFFTAVLVMLQMVCARGMAAGPATNSTWVDAWAVSYLSTTVNGTPYANVPTFNNQTLRMNMFAKLGGTALRVKFTDRFATNPVVIGEAHLALRSGTSGSGIVQATDHVLTFDGATNLTLAAGEERWSDPVTLVVTQHQDVTISVFLPQPIKPTTFHFVAKTGYYVSGDHCTNASFTSPSTTSMYFFVSDLQVMAPANSRVIVALGDSITDGSCATIDANDAWPDVLSMRLPALSDGTPVGVINMGIGSNRFVTTNAAGLPGLNRLDDDVLSRSNVTHLILLEGINDISYEHVLPEDLIAAYQQAIDRAHAKGIKVFGATLLPIGNSVKYTTTNEATRQAVNKWVRESGRFDAVLDFEKVVRDTNFNPLRIQSSLTCGDYVHPNNQGYLLIGNSVPLNLFNVLLDTFYAPRFDTNGIVHWWLDLDPGQDYMIEASPNLTDWTNFLTVTNTSSILFSDPDSTTQKQRFFRARQQP
jgi:lysophospholipase L1-like esterase